MRFTEDDLLHEAGVKASRSGGKGGQHVNKVSSKVELKFDIRDSLLFSEAEKDLLLSRLANRLSSDSAIRVVSQESRSQLSNKQTAVKKLYEILSRALQQNKLRKATKPKPAAVEKRLRDKQLKAQKKILRRPDFN